MYSLLALLPSWNGQSFSSMDGQSPSSLSSPCHKGNFKTKLFIKTTVDLPQVLHFAIASHRKEYQYSGLSQLTSHKHLQQNYISLLIHGDKQTAVSSGRRIPSAIKHNCRSSIKYDTLARSSQPRSRIARMNSSEHYPVLGREDVLSEIFENFGMDQEDGKRCRPPSPRPRQLIKAVTQVTCKQ